MNKIRSAILLAACLTVVPLASWPVTPDAGETAQCRSYFEHFFPTQATTTPESFLKIVSEDGQESVCRGMSWRGTPFQIGDQVYSHGIAFNASKRIRIQLATPGDSFHASVGLENNDSTQQGAKLGNGSVRFHVFVKDEEVFTSPVMRLSDKALEVNVPLNGENAFEIAVDDAGDGRGWDQALWANATVTLSAQIPNEEKPILRLQDIPWFDDIYYNPAVFSFLYDNQPSRDLLPGWTIESSEKNNAPQTSRTITYTDPKTNLEIRIEATRDQEFPVMEWVINLKNKGTTDTPILENIQAFDTIVPSAGINTTKLHWSKGGVASFDDFAPQEVTLDSNKPLHFQPGGGRSSNQVLPFFNLESGNGGIITAVGWSGEWAFDINAAPHGNVLLKAGMAQTHLRLHPGEEIRTPRMLLLFYQGDQWRGQNLFRQYILARHRPLRDGKPLESPITCGNWGGTSAAVHLDNIHKIIQQGMPMDYYWIDAEWYGGPGSWAVNVGTWQYKKDLYPHGFKPLSDALKEDGRNLMLWFEPERVFKNTEWYTQHHDWLLDRGGENVLFNLGNPEALAFLIKFISDRIDEFGLGCYRQDFNIDPLDFWKNADEPDRVGITEIRYIEGLYAFWDGLLQRHPNLIIDNCASGGRRIDLETIGRSTPFWRTDGPRDPIAHQCHTFGLLPWVPFSATSQDHALDDYEFRSSMCSSLCLNWWVSGDAPAENIPDTFPFEWAKKTLNQYVDFRKYYYGDFYPLTRYSQSKDVWMAYQLDRPDLGEGLIVILKRPQSPYQSAQFNLQALPAGANYEVHAVGDDSNNTHLTIAPDHTFEATLTGQPDSMLAVYKRVEKK